jgi:hypothetical protein
MFETKRKEECGSKYRGKNQFCVCGWEMMDLRPGLVGIGG